MCKWITCASCSKCRFWFTLGESLHFQASRWCPRRWFMDHTFCSKETGSSEWIKKIHVTTMSHSMYVVHIILLCTHTHTFIYSLILNQSCCCWFLLWSLIGWPDKHPFHMSINYILFIWASITSSMVWDVHLDFLNTCSSNSSWITRNVA